VHLPHAEYFLACITHRPRLGLLRVRVKGSELGLGLVLGVRIRVRVRVS